MSSTLRRAAFALRFGEYNLLGSGLINKDSRILYIRDVKERVQTLAPFLDFDADPYPVITNGRLVWVIDGYTTSSRYPYSENADNDELAAGSGLHHTYNYVRNSVKATVDAYDGTVTFYVVDPSDPIVTAWSKAFPGLFTSGDAGPARAGGPLPLPGGPVPGADQHVRPLPRRRPQPVLPAGSVLERRPGAAADRRPRLRAGHDVEHVERDHDDQHALGPLQPVLHAAPHPRAGDTGVLVGAAVRAVLGERRAEEPHLAHVGVQRSRRRTGSCASSTSSRRSRSTVPRSWTRSSSGSTRPTSRSRARPGPRCGSGRCRRYPSVTPSCGCARGTCRRSRRRSRSSRSSSWRTATRSSGPGRWRAR